MKTKLQILIAVLSIVFSMAMASAQQSGLTTTTSLSRMIVNPDTGLPEEVPNIDPATGLPADGSPPFKDSNGSPTWIDPAWKDSNNVQSSVDFSALPLSEVIPQLLERFNNDFDIISPNTPGFDPTQTDIQLQLKNVKASEIFSAMNLQFELDKSPLRWELTVNGSRPTAILRNLPQSGPPPPPQIRKVFYVGDIFDQYPGTNDMLKLQTISDAIYNVWRATGMNEEANINNYPSGQLLIISGAPDQVDLAEQTLRALKEKAEFQKTGTLAEPRNPQ